MQYYAFYIILYPRTLFLAHIFPLIAIIYTSPMIHAFMHLHPLPTQPILDGNGNGQLTPGTGLFLSEMGSSPCVDSPFVQNYLCGNLLFLVTGFNERHNINMVMHALQSQTA